MTESTEKENKSVTPSSSELLDQRIFELREEARLLEAEIQLLEQEDGTCNGGVAPLEGTAVCEGQMEEMVDEIVYVGVNYVICSANLEISLHITKSLSGIV